MNTASILINQQPKYDNVISLFPDSASCRKTTSLYKSNGIPKATAADPIRNPTHIKAIQCYYRNKGQIRNYTIFTMGIVFGIRAGDLCEMRIHHILNTDGSFKAHCGLYEQKTRKFNNPVITPTMQSILKEYLDSLGDYHQDDYLFRSRQRDKNGNYRPITIQQLNNVIKEAAKAVGVSEHISSHSLRKTFAYQLLQQNPGNDEVKFALQKMLNHNDFKTTLTYCGMTQDTLDKYRVELEEMIL